MTDDELHWLTVDDGRRGAPLRVGVVTDAGPRVAALHLGDGPNLFAELSDVEASAGPGGPAVALHGGHRIWVAPETAERTYVDDDRPLDVTVSGTQVVASRVHEGLRRTLTVRVADGAVLVDHELANEGDEPIRCASWGITQFPLGGTALLPLGRQPRDPAGLQASGALTVWPYTDLADPRLRLGPGWAGLEGTPHPDIEDPGPELHHVKIGGDGFVGWVVHLRDGVLFTKWHDPPASGAHALDLGAIAQVYVDDRFAEVESLGTVSDLAPGSTRGHRERWEVTTVGDAGLHEVASALTGRATSGRDAANG